MFMKASLKLLLFKTRTQRPSAKYTHNSTVRLKTSDYSKCSCLFTNLLVKVIESLCLNCLGRYKIIIKGIKSREKFRVISCFEPDG